MESFSGGVFSDSVRGGRSGAALTIRDGRLLATLPRQTNGTGPLDLTLDLHNCTVELGGASGRMWFCRNPDRSLTAFSEAEGFGEALSSEPCLRANVRELLDQTRAHRQRTRFLVASALFAGGLCLIGGYFALRNLSEHAVLALPEEADVKLGKLAIATMDIGGPVVHLPAVQEGIQTIVDRLDAHDGSQFKYHVRVVDAPVTNAFALPGGELVVYTGLIRAAKSPEEVAAVLAHEIGHVVHRDGLQRIAQSAGLITAVQLLIGDMGGLAAVGTEILQQGALLSYGREQESEADRFGVELLHRAKITPFALSAFFTTLAETTEPLPDELAWLSTHPDLTKRIADIEALADKQGRHDTIPLDLDFNVMQKALGGATTKPAVAPDSTVAPANEETAHKETAHKETTHGN